MRRAVGVLTAVLVAAVLTSCSGPLDEGGPAPELRGQWLLTDARDQGGSLDLLHQYLTLTIDRDATTNGRSSCSDYSAAVFGAPDSLWVQAVLPRQINCGTSLQQTLEDRYIADLNTIRSATAGRDGLHLMSAGVDLHYRRVAPTPLKPLQNRTWHTETVTSISLVSNDSPYSLTETGASIRFDDGILTGSTPCGVISAHYAQNTGQIVADHVVVKTRPTCNADDQALDDYLVQLIDSGFTVKTSHRALIATSNRALLQMTFSEDEFR